MYVHLFPLFEFLANSLTWEVSKVTIYEWTVTLEHGVCVCFEYTKLGFDPQHFVSPRLSKGGGW